MSVATRIGAARAELEAARTDLVAFLETERSRRRGPAVQQLHEVRRMLSAAYRYTSQAGQDAVVDWVLKGRRGGVFVDVGGHDGVTGSNTLFLEVFRGWTGLLVEPVAAHLTRARAVRRCPCLGVAVAAVAGRAEFIEVRAGLTQMSGLSESYDPGLLDRVRADPRHREELREVETRTLPSLFDEVGTRRPDFVSLDMEGGEAPVLEAFPFDTCRPRVWAIENNGANRRIPQILRAAGYDLVEFCGPDEIYLDSRPD